MFPEVAVHRVKVAREAVTYAHCLPQALVLQELIPIPTHTRGPRKRARIVDEAEDVQRNFGGQRAEEVALEERPDKERGQEDVDATACTQSVNLVCCDWSATGTS